ncbi:hypothetical protein ABE10_06220, partial [Bacillus toyonensis]|nr:hypothetical protein [Bacillus toyonensis]
DDERAGRDHHEESAGRAEAHDIAHHEGQNGGDAVADGVCQQRAGERGDTGDRQRSEAVEHPLVHVLAKLGAGDHGGGDHGLHEDARDDHGQVAAHVSGDGAAEDVGEHQREQDGLQGHVEELFRRAADLHETTARHRQRVAEGLP